MKDDLPALLPEPPGAPQFAPELDEALVAGHVPDEVKARFVIAPDDLGAADWAMRNRKALQAERERVDAYADQGREPYTAWQEAEHRRLQPSIELFDGMLERWALDVRAADARHKTMALPSGTVKTTARGPQLQIVDEAKVIAWAEENLDAAGLADVVQTTKKAYVKELAKRVRLTQRPNGQWVAVDTSTGTYVPGTRVLPEDAPTAKVVL